jgi:GH24 family phage-related lysozyme (muramidase)
MSNFLSAARWTDKDQPQPHQIAAWNIAWNWLSKDQQEEFLETFRSAPKLPPQTWLEPAIQIIKQFEGLRLDAYLCPANVPTIGYGATSINGRPVKIGDKITEVQALQLLQEQIKNVYAPGVFGLIPASTAFRPAQQAALISWAFNVGLSAVEESTLRKRIANKENPITVISEELIKWDKADGKPLEGLTRRRKAEIELFIGRTEVQQQTAKLSPSASFSSRLTPHITLGEFALNEEARRFRHQYQLDTAAELAGFLERVRLAFGGKPIIITSGYRTPAINHAVGGASNSEHLFDAPGVGAVDFWISGANIEHVQDWCDKNWPYSVGYGAKKGFVHLGIRKGRPRVRWDY